MSSTGAGKVAASGQLRVRADADVMVSAPTRLDGAKASLKLEDAASSGGTADPRVSFAAAMELNGGRLEATSMDAARPADVTFAAGFMAKANADSELKDVKVEVANSDATVEADAILSLVSED